MALESCRYLESALAERILDDGLPGKRRNIQAFQLSYLLERNYPSLGGARLKATLCRQ
jgi:hypothetical protein